MDRIYQSPEIDGKPKVDVQTVAVSADVDHRVRVETRSISDRTRGSTIRRL